MAEQVQAILERMVLPLKDLRTRGLFSPDEVRSIVERRRQSEYLLQRRSAARKSDYLRYIEDEILLERLRKLRKEKVLTEMKNERIRRLQEDNGSDDNDSDDGGHNRRKHAYQTSGPGDSHILAHIHFLYQRTLKKFHYPLDVLLNYAQFAKDYKSFHMLSRIYAEGLQHHPREAGLWIEAASFEYFGYVAQDYEKGKQDGNMNSKVVGSSIQNARVLMQRGLRINRKNSKELWLQYFALELHYVQKLRGRKEILELGKLAEEREESNGNDVDSNNEKEGTKIPTALLPSQIIFKNAIKAIPSDIQFRLRFVEACRTFPQTKGLEECIMESITRDFGDSVEAWVARISYAEEALVAKKGKNGAVEFLDWAKDEVFGGDGGEDRPAKKARVDSRASDPALVLLQEALEAVLTPTMYLESSRFLRLRIQRLLDSATSSVEDDEEEDVSHLIGKNESAEEAAQRHVHLLEELYQNAKRRGISSTSLTLDEVDYLLSAEQPQKAEELLSNAVSSSKDVDARLWLRWAEIAQQMMEESSSAVRPSSTPTRILRRALKQTPIHDRRAHTLILTELMQHLMAQPLSPKTNEELKSLFEKLLLLSQGSSVSISSIKKSSDNEDEMEDDNEVNVASTFLAYLKYTMLNNSNNDAIRTIYTSILYHSNYGKSCAGKSGEEVMTMKSIFDLCIQFELANKKKEKKKARKMCLCKLYEAAVGFYQSGGSPWRKVVDGYQRDLQDAKYAF